MVLWSRLSPIVKALKNVCFTHKKKIITGVAIVAAAVVTYKKSSLLRRTLLRPTLRFLSYPFRKAYDWIGSEEPGAWDWIGHEEPDPSAEVPAAPITPNLAATPRAAALAPVSQWLRRQPLQLQCQ